MVKLFIKYLELIVFFTCFNTSCCCFFRICIRGDVAQWVARLTCNVEVVGSSPSKAPVVSLSKKLYPYCLVLVGSWKRFESDVTIETKIN